MRHLPQVVLLAVLRLPQEEPQVILQRVPLLQVLLQPVVLLLPVLTPLQRAQEFLQ